MNKNIIYNILLKTQINQFGADKKLLLKPYNKDKLLIIRFYVHNNKSGVQLMT